MSMERLWRIFLATPDSFIMRGAATAAGAAGIDEAVDVADVEKARPRARAVLTAMRILFTMMTEIRHLLEGCGRS